ncbi:MAG: hypothetical protein NT151_05665 [Acidobacteria bacterium]|nr:hypothetical protein [Acidobacteriota bacterium]
MAFPVATLYVEELKATMRGRFDSGGMTVQHGAAAALLCESADERGIGVTVPRRGEPAFR